MQLHLLLIFTEEIRQTRTIHKLYWSCTVPVFCQKTNSGLNEQLLKSVQSMFWVIRKSKHFFFFFWYCNKNIFDFRSIWNFVSTTNNFQINTALARVSASTYLFVYLSIYLIFWHFLFFILIIILLLWSNKFR